MNLDAERDGTNGVNSEQTAAVRRSTQPSPRVTRRVSVRLSEQMFQQLEAATGGVSSFQPSPDAEAYKSAGWLFSVTFLFRR
jgi:hypothetical protein